MPARQYTNGGIYIDPTTDQATITTSCNFAPVFPCVRKDWFTDFTIETQGDGRCKFHAGKMMCLLEKIASGVNLSVFDTNVSTAFDAAIQSYAENVLGQSSAEAQTFLDNLKANVAEDYAESNN